MNHKITVATFLAIGALIPFLLQQASAVTVTQYVEYIGTYYVYCSTAQGCNAHYWKYVETYDWIYYNGLLDHITGDKLWSYSWVGWSGPWTVYGDQYWIVCSVNPYIYNVPYCGNV